MKTTACIFAALFLFRAEAHAQDSVLEFPSGIIQDLIAEESHQAFSFFGSDDVLEMTLQFDLREFARTKMNPESLPAHMTVKTGNGDTLHQEIKMKARGEFRRSCCSFPPIMLNFKTDTKMPDAIQNGGKVKLVTHCNQTPASETYVLKEFLAYQLYHLLTPFSFKTRLVKITYIDSRKPYKSYTEFGFLIESVDSLAARNHAVEVKTQMLTQKEMEKTDMARVALFNFMIGNTDWYVPLQHNIKVLKPADIPSEKGIPVVYDFDYAGLVNASYAVPNEALPIKHVTERLYLGICLEDETIKPVIEEFMAAHEILTGTIRNFNYLPEGHKKQAESYIESFYNMFSNQNNLIAGINKTCRRF